MVLIGGGAAALAVLEQLAGQRILLDGRAPRVTVIDPVHRLRDAPADRTWCSWVLPGEDDLPAAATWSQVRLAGPIHGQQTLDLHPFVYRMVEADGYARHVAALVESAGVHLDWITEPAGRVRPGAAGVNVDLVGGGVVTARYALDSRPAPVPEGTVLQHFLGQVLELPEGGFNPSLATLMDFRMPQPPGGVAFGYVLPIDARTALVEYTQFSTRLLRDDEYRRALASYLEANGIGQDASVLRTERGVIPMSDRVPARRLGERWYALGSAAGATRGSTGYTFAAARRQAGVVVAALAAGKNPLPPPAYPARHRALDAVFLQALRGETLCGSQFFEDLFFRCPAPTVLRFLDGTSSRAEEARVLRASPATAMLRAVAQLGRSRIRHGPPMQ